MIDLRSDTVTRPTPEMRKAMAEAEVGDDVYGEDPTVNALEEKAAQRLGKEAGLFVPTGTMGNTIAIKMHTEHGQEVICEARSHVLDWELSMMAWFAGCLARPVETSDGILLWKRIKSFIRKGSPHNAATALITLENTHNMAGGSVYPVDAVDEICRNAHEAGLKVHMDGARIFNAAQACGMPAGRIVQHVDSVMFCLSKGLGAPVGSLVVGRRDDIEQGRLYRKRLGGGMRQAGVLAAAGLIALERGTERLSEDHVNARTLAGRLAGVPGIAVDPAAVQTNIVIFGVRQTGLTGAQFSDELKRRGVLANSVGSDRIRFVTHRDVSPGECEEAADIVKTVASAPVHSFDSRVDKN
jgi:threonine aldolase